MKEINADAWQARSKSDRHNHIAGEIIMRCRNFAYRYDYTWADIPESLEHVRCSGVAVGKDGNIYAVFQTGERPVAVFAPDGGLITRLGGGLEWGKPHSISVTDRGDIWVVDADLHIARCLDGQGNCTMTLGTIRQGSDTGVDTSLYHSYLAYLTIRRRGAPFNRPTKLIQAPNGNLYASDGYWNSALHIFSPDGTRIRSVGSPGQEDGEFNIPHSVWADRYNRIWVADRDNDRVQIFSPEGDHLTSINGLLYPSDIWSDDHHVYIAELDRRISIYDMDYQMVAQLGYCASPYKAHGIAGDRMGNLYLGIYGTYPLVRLKRL